MPGSHIQQPMSEFPGRGLLGPCLLALFSPMLSWCQLPYPMFQDVPIGAAYYDEVHLLGERMITHGCTVVPNNYCPGWTLTRGQAAVLIVRSIFSGRSGDPDNFPYPQEPYFTDVPPSHPQFAYIQKMRELGITSGYTATTYYPEGSLSFSQLAVFTYRGRQLRFNQPLTPPPACTFSFLDVSSSHPFCGYIQTIYYGWLGENAKSPNCYTGLCPDSLAVDRGTSAFYLVTGIMASTVPEFLPNSAGQLPAVNLATFPGLDECNHGSPQYGDYYYANRIDVIGQYMRAWADTGVINPSNPVVWDNYVALDFWQSGSWPPLFTQSYSTGSGLDNAHLASGYHFANSSYNYLSDSRHQVTSFCITGGSTTLQTKNDPMILSTNTTVLYRGMTQAVTFRGSSLGSVQGVESPHATLGGSVLNSQQFQATVNVTTPSNATAGNISVRLSAVAPVPQVQNGFAPTSGESHKTNYLTMTVADPTPIITSIRRTDGIEFVPGDANSFQIMGVGFGTNMGTLQFSPAIGYGITSWTSISITGVISLPEGSGGQTVTVRVTSAGSGASGFAPAPGGGSTPLSAGVALAIIQLLISQSPQSLNMTTADQASIDVTLNTLDRVTTSFAVNLVSNPYSNCAASLSVPGRTITGAGNTPQSHPVSGSGSGCTGIYNVVARANGSPANIGNTSTRIVVPPLKLVQMMWGESNLFHGRADIYETQQALGYTVSNRFGDNEYFAGINTWQAALVGGEYNSLRRTDLPLTGVQPELNNASEVFTGTSTATAYGAQCFFTPTPPDWQERILPALASGTSETPSGLQISPGCYPVGQRQFLIRDGMSTFGDGRPGFILVRVRPNPGDPAVIRLP